MAENGIRRSKQNRRKNDSENVAENGKNQRRKRIFCGVESKGRINALER